MQIKKILDKIKQEPTIFLFRKMWHFAGERKKYIVVVIVLQIIAQSVILIEPLIFAKLINELQTNGVGDNIRYLLFTTSLFFVVAITFWLFHATARILERRNAFLIELAYHKHVLKGLFDLSLQWHSDRDSGSTIDKISNASTALFQFSAGSYNFVGIIIRLFGTSIILLTFSLYLGIGAFIVTVFALAILFRFDKFLIPQYKEMIKDENKISAGIFDALANVSSVFILHIQNPVLKNIEKLMLKPWNIYKKNVTLVEAKWFTGDIIFNLLVVIPLSLYILYIYRNNLIVEIGTVTALYMYLSRMNRVFHTLAMLYENTILRKTNVENAEEIEEAIEANQAKQQEKMKIADWQEMQIHNLNFSYIGPKVKQQELHLGNVNLSIKSGERIAFIGESGSGKTTFLKVLHGLYDSASARLTFTGHHGTPSDMQTNFTDIDLATMLVPQEPEIFSSTIKENITLGLPTKKEEIDKVLKLARFDYVVEKLPKGLKSVINEKGVNLSGGQKQRLALARALLFAKDKEILLLDESTSSVDPENEAQIYEGIFSEYTGKTILASIHKMNLLKYFDRIVMFDDGKIVDQGTFEELLQKNKKFKREWEVFVRSSA